MNMNPIKKLKEKIVGNKRQQKESHVQNKKNINERSIVIYQKIKIAIKCMSTIH